MSRVHRAIPRSSPKPLIQRGLLLAVAALAIVFMGRVISTGSDIALMAVVSVVGVVVVSFRPFAGLYVCYVLLLISPLLDQRFNVPIFRSPLQAIALITVAAALLRFPMQDRSLPKSKVFLPLFSVLAVYLGFVLTGHGPDASRLLYEMAAGMWPLPLILLLVQTRKQATRVLVAICATCVALTVLWLPGLLALSQSKSGELGAQIRFGVREDLAQNPGAASLLGFVGSLGVQTLVALALVAPVLLGIAMTGRRGRLVALVGYLTISLTVFTATIASAVAAWAIGTVALLGFLAMMPRRVAWDRIRPIGSTVLLIVILALVLINLPPGDHVIWRLTHPADDVSGSVRINDMTNGWHAFLERPTIGHGAQIGYRYTPQGWSLSSHSTWVVIGFTYGLVALVPVAWLMTAIGRELWRLNRGSRDAREGGISAGFLAAFTSFILTGFLTPTLAQIFQDTIIWTFVGLAIVWNDWRRKDPEAPLLAEDLLAAQPVSER